MTEQKAHTHKKDLNLGKVSDPVNECQHQGRLWDQQVNGQVTMIGVCLVDPGQLSNVWMTLQYVSIQCAPAVIMNSSQCDSVGATPMWNKYLTQPGFVWRHHLPCFGGTGSCSMTVCLGNLDQTGVDFFFLFYLNMANWLDGNPAENNESQPCGGFHSQAVHSWPDKGILYTAPTRTHWKQSTVAWQGPLGCVRRLEKDLRQN